MERPVRSLKLELLRPPGQEELSKALSCSLDKKQSCCDGIGYRLGPSGSLTQASLCSCVKECSACFGLNRIVTDGRSRSCRTPAPSRVVSLINSACLPARYSAARLDSFANDSGNGKEVVRRLSTWMREFHIEQPRGLVLGGPVGVGKTYLLAAIAKNFASKGISVRFIDFVNLVNELRAGFEQGTKGNATIMKEANDVDVLIIDELGKGRNTEWESSVIDQLVMGRYNQNKIIIASTNYDIKPSERVSFPNGNLDDRKPSNNFELDRFESLEQRVGTRVYSRLVETSDFIELTGDDFRKRAQGRRPKA